MTNDPALGMAGQACAFWRATARPPRLIKARENIVYQIWLADGRPAALRLHRPGYQSEGAIRAELDWTAELARLGQPVPPPVAGHDGGWTCTVANRVASVVGWRDGAAIGASDRRLDGDAAAQAGLFDRIGQLVGGIHNASDRIGFARAPDRPRWDIDGLLGDAPLWGCFWQNPALTGPEADLINAARASARRWLQGQTPPTGDFGLIHADVLRENVLDGPDGLALIDVDGSGYGFRLYDLGTALVQSLEEPHLPLLARALARGYGAARGTAAPDLQSLTLFTLLRAMASCGWIVTRAHPHDPRQRFYAERALSLARHWLAGTTPLG